MRRIAIVSVLLILCCVQVAPVFASAPHADPPTLLFSPTNQVVLIIAPYLTWEDIDETTTPRIYRLSIQTAIGNLNARSRVKDFDGKPSLLEGALSLSAGAWSRVDASARAPYNTYEMVEGAEGFEMYERLVGKSTGEAKIAYLGLPRMIAVNASGDFTVTPGLLGSAIENAGGVTAAIGNSDLGSRYTAEHVMRPAALIAMNENGLVRLGSVSPNLLEMDSTSPYGVRTNREALAEEIDVVARAIRADRPSLIVIDPGDLYRARSSMRDSTVEAAERNWKNALSTLDWVYTEARDSFPRATILIASQASMNPNLNREGLGPLIVSLAQSDPVHTEHGSVLGEYMLSSDSTQRRGLSTNLDLSATIYSLLEIPASIEVLGAPLYAEHSAKGGWFDRIDDRQAHFIESNNTALSVDSLRGTVVGMFIWVTALLLVVGGFALVRANNHWKKSTALRVREALNIVILGCLSLPAASWLMFVIDRWPQTPTAVLAQLLVTTAALWIVAYAIARVRKGASGIIFLGAITALVVILDQMVGAPFSFSGFFSYSPIMAFRFYGLGNEGAALLYGATVIAFTLWLDRVEKPQRYTTWLLATGGFFVMLICAAPWWGANVGVAAWGTVGYAVLVLLTNDKKVTWKSVGLMLIAIVLILGVLIVIDRYGSGGQTHLARSIGMAEQGGVAPLVEIVVRKAATNFRVLTASMWGTMFVAVMGFLVAMRVRPAPELTRTLEANKFFSDGMAAILVGGITAFFTEDSGIVLPAIMVLYLGCALLWLMLERLRGREGQESGIESVPIVEGGGGE